MSPAIAEGTRLGPYEVVELLGRGGMGEVYRARDPRLGRDVAVKVLPADVAGDTHRLARFEREARAVAALNHPNVLSVYDVGSTDGTAYLVTELLEGRTLREQMLGPPPSAKRALGLALQVARGLEAAHAKGIVHRDVKPENILLTEDGRVKILDFGVAKLIARGEAATAETTGAEPSHPGELAGTLSYMSPEQARGQPVDARTDVFSLGVVLYELLSGRHPFRRSSATATLQAILGEEPEDLTRATPGVPAAVSAAVQRCLSKPREGRYASAHELAVALEALLGAPSGERVAEPAEERSPYPGLASFTERDAALFFGREPEIAALWERLRQRKLLALIGSSGAGKTSLVRAGLLAGRPEGWGTLVARPGRSPLMGLARALAPEVAGDAEAVESLLRFDEPKQVVEAFTRWRRGYREALLAVDQLEELFTLNPPEVQARYADLLGRLAHEADLHVLLSLRDDFLIRCAEHPSLRPVFESLTPLLPLSGEALRRVLVEPAGSRGFGFEEGLVEEMVSAVEGERGALPLLAFAAARLWERRDVAQKRLTREAYAAVGGVAGALARHAEETLERIGLERQGVVREVFRNLVTSHGTRAACEREELLSVFDDRAPLEAVLRELIDARLLTSYEASTGDDGRGHHRIEVVHESLLREWPRLVRWQAQDEEGALLRDQLKQAAHLWEERGRAADLLWSGTSLREYALWRERYPGALTAVEEAFAAAMVARARRRRRLRRTAGALAVVGSLAVAALVGVSRQQAVRSAERAERQALLAEASRLVALGRNQLETYPTAALAYARKSLEVADTEQGRRLALEALWQGPIARVLPLARLGNWTLDFDRSGRWLSVSGVLDQIAVYADDGSRPTLIEDLRVTGNPRAVGFHPGRDVLATSVFLEGTVRLFSVPEGAPLGRFEAGPRTGFRWTKRGVVTRTLTRVGDRERWLFRLWHPGTGEARVLAELDVAGTCGSAVSSDGEHLVYSRGNEVWSRLLSAPWTEQRITHLAEPPLSSGLELVGCLALSRGGDVVATITQGREIQLWPARPGAREPTRVLRGMGTPASQSPLVLAPTGDWVAWGTAEQQAVYLWDVLAPRDARFLRLRRPDTDVVRSVRFTPNGRWLAVANGDSVAFWPVARRYAHVLLGHSGSRVPHLSFSADSAWLASGAEQGDGVRLWPLAPRGSSGYDDDRPFAEWPYSLTFDPARPRLLVAGPAGPVVLFPIPAGPERRLMGPTWGPNVAASGHVTFDAAGARVAWSAGYSPDPQDRVIRIWDLESGAESVMPLCDDCDPAKLYDRGLISLRFAPDGTLYGAGYGGVRRWNVETGRSEWLLRGGLTWMDLSRDGRRLVAATGASDSPCIDSAELTAIEVRTGATAPIANYGTSICQVAFDVSGDVLATAGGDGIVRVGAISGGEPHLLLGHRGPVTGLALSPDGRWIASASGTEIRLWPMPDVTQPPFHTLPYGVLMTKLHSFTNLEVVADPSAPTGYRLEIGPFSGWREVPTW